MEIKGMYQYNVKALSNQAKELMKERKTAAYKSYTQNAMCSLSQAF